MRRERQRAPWLAPLFLVAATIAATGCSSPGSGPDTGSTTPTSSTSAANGAGTARSTPTSDAGPGQLPQADVGEPRVLVKNLAVPWGIDFLPGGDALITERDSARVLRVSPQGKLREVGTIEPAQPRGEGGLLGLEVSPTFSSDRWVYMYYTTADDNRVARWKYEDGQLRDKQVLVSGIPAASIHNGGRLLFGPDGMLYASTGEAGVESRAQDLDSLGGKILRMKPNGDPAPGNPNADSVVYSYGHRNVEGLAFGPAKQLYATEFGGNEWDEINIIQRNHNYGWPEVEGTSDGDEYTDPVVTWRPAQASPSGAEIAGGSMWVAALRGSRLWRVPLNRDGSVGKPTALLGGEYGRLRTVTTAPDGSLWLTTSNRDGRGTPARADDRILVLPLDSS